MKNLLSRCLVVVCLLLVPQLASAQSLHNHPQCQHYVAATVPIDPGVTCHRPTLSAQLHWRILVSGHLVPDNTCALAPTDDLTCAHIHNDLVDCPYLAELSAGDVITCGLSLTLHHFPGYVYAYYPGILHATAPDIIWDATGTTTPPALVGDPLGDKVFTGHFTTSLPPNVKGWYFLTNQFKFHLSDGVEGSPELLMPFWSMQQPTSGEILSYHLPALRAASNLNDPNHPGVTWGQLTVEYDDYLPVAPIAQPWNTSIAFYSYGRPDLKPGVDQIRYDMDLHHEVPGRIVFDTTRAEDLGMAWTFDPSVIGPGTHKVAALRVQPDGTEQLTTVLVTTITVDSSVPPPTCTPPAVLQNGQCVSPPPPPPPPPTWMPTTVQPQQDGDHMRLMRPDGKVVDLPDAHLP